TGRVSRNRRYRDHGLARTSGLAARASNFASADGSRRRTAASGRRTVGERPNSPRLRPVSATTARRIHRRVKTFCYVKSIGATLPGWGLTARPWENRLVHAAAVCFDLHVPESRSLKAKRAAIRPL